MATVKPSYLRDNFTGSNASQDSALAVCISTAERWVAGIIGQPLEASAVVHNFAGHGYETRLCPYTIAPSITTVEARDTLSASFVEVDGVELIGNAYALAGGFVRAWYRVTLSVGVAPITTEDYSTDYVGTLAPLLAIVCEVATVKFLESPLSNDGVRRFALDSLAESQGGTVTKSYKFRDMVDGWREALAPFRILRTFGQ